ncbi:hypothetical protein AB870_15685 [Pandoraea faecigallinarum]|uniref:EscE/YscE/SsaE family type III secretion system needle protein co-chaperone n=1 Tax=Pandoraea faecigallinarum TaxID=656179 RepID=A0A0H3WU37_9BURK|nr:EscE/YscE/SsaE family type III secretion system needle protein co-chaperone [Pandoraea faecigallinarum]AKM31257.1 hypothetical protein AB870_15685 [Pandoraea faecigallinarum]
MTLRLTRLEDALAVSPDTVSRDVAAKLDRAGRTLDAVLRTPLTPPQHARARTQKQAVTAAQAILESLSRRYSTSYGKLP